jgi:hypothetical protein
MESRASSRVVPVALPSFLSTVQPLYLNTVYRSVRGSRLDTSSDPDLDQGEGTQPPSLLSPPGPGSVRLCNAMETELPHSPSLPHPAS